MLLSASFQKQVTVTPQQAFLLTYKQKIYKRRCPQTTLQPAYPPTTSIMICSPTQPQACQAQTLIKKFLRETQICIIDRPASMEQLTNNPTYVSLKRDYEFELLTQKEFELQLNYTAKVGLTEVARHFAGRTGICVLISEDMGQVKDEIVRVLGTQQQQQAVGAMVSPRDGNRAEPQGVDKNRSNKFTFELNLKISNKDLFLCYLGDVLQPFMGSSQHVLFDKYDLLHVRGQKDKCGQIRTKIHQQIDKLSLLIIQTRNIGDLQTMIRQTPPQYGMRHFTKQQALQKCDRMLRQYFINQPRIILQQITQKLQVIIFLVLKHYRNSFCRHFRKYTNKSSAETNYGCLTVQPSNFDKGDFEEYMKDLGMTPQDVITHAHEDKFVIRIVNAAVKEKVQEYVNHTEYCFVAGVDREVAEHFVGKRRGGGVQLVEGYSPHQEKDILSDFTKKKQARNCLITNTHSQSPLRPHPFLCLVITGTRSQCLRTAKQFQQFKRKPLTIEQQWKVELPDWLQKNFKDVTTLIDRKMQEKVRELEKIVKLQRKSIEGWIYGVVYEKGKEDGIGIVKQQFIMAVKNGIQHLKIQGFQRLEDLRKIKEVAKLGDFVEYQSQVFLVGFSDLGSKLSSINKCLQSYKVSQDITIPLSTYSIIKDRLSTYPQTQAKLTIRQAKQYVILTISGLSHHAQPLLNRLRAQLNQAEDRMQKQSIQINKSEYFILNSSPVIAALREEFKATIEVVENKGMAGVLVRTNNSNVLEIVPCIIEGLVATRLRVYTAIRDVGAQEIADSIKIAGKASGMHNKTLNYLYFQNISDIDYILKQAIKLQSPLALYCPPTHQLNNFIIYLLSYLSSKQNLPIITLCARQNEEKAMNSRISWLLKDRSVKALGFESQWNYEDDDGKWKEYGEDVQKKLATAVRQKDEVLVLGHKDFGKKTGTVGVSVNRTRMQLYYGQYYQMFAEAMNYYFKIGTKKYVIPNEYNDTINKAVNDTAIYIDFYDINLKSQTQTNIFTKKVRKIKLIKPNQNKSLDSLKIIPLPSTYWITISTDRTRMSLTKKSLKQRLQQILKQSRTHSALITYPHKQITAQQFQRMCKQQCLLPSPGVQVLKDGDSAQVRVVGYSEKDLDQLRNQIQLVSRMVVTSLDYPVYWTKNAADIDEVQVMEGTEEFRKIQAEFKIATIRKLTRIQNTYLWKKYCQEKINQQELTELPPNELYLFHGTGHNAPQKIYRDKQQSFNINYSSESNMFGKGIYFAKEASYSNSGYVHNSIRGGKILLYCRVNVGVPQEMGQHQGRSDMKDTDIRDNAKGIRYGCRKSTYGGSDIYIIYKSGRAYPEYVIEYDDRMDRIEQQPAALRGLRQPQIRPAPRAPQNALVRYMQRQFQQNQYDFDDYDI